MLHTRRPSPSVAPRDRGPIAASLRARAADERGISLVEVLVSALIVALIATAVAVALIAGADTDADQRYRSQAAELAQQDQERLKGLSALQLTDLAPPNQETRTVTLNGIPYQITSTANFLNSTGGAACGSTGAGAAAYYQVISQVTWGINHRGPVTSQSLITPPAGGTLLTDVEDQTGAPLPGVSVERPPAPTRRRRTTDSSGLRDLLRPRPRRLHARAHRRRVRRSRRRSGESAQRLGDGHQHRHGDAERRQPDHPRDWPGRSTPTSPPTVGTLTGQQADAVSWYGAGTSDSMSIYKYQRYGASAPTDVPCHVHHRVLRRARVDSRRPARSPLFPFEFTGPSYTGNYAVWAGPCRQEAATGRHRHFSPCRPGRVRPSRFRSRRSTSSSPTTERRVAPAHIKMSVHQLERHLVRRPTWSAGRDGRGQRGDERHRRRSPPRASRSRPRPRRERLRAPRARRARSRSAPTTATTRYTGVQCTTRDFAAATRQTIDITSASTSGTC